MTTPGCSLDITPMNDFPIPEDPPVTTTAAYLTSSSLSEDTVNKGFSF
jgi:hypothetical protein